MAFQVAGTAGRSLAIAGVVFSAILLPIDMVFFGISLKKLRDEEKSKQAEEIRAWLEQSLPDEEQISQVVARLKQALLDFIKKVRSQSIEHDEESVSESEERLRLTLEEIKSMIESNVT